MTDETQVEATSTPETVEQVETAQADTVAEQAESPQAVDSPTEKPDEGKKKAGIEKRISELTAKRREAEARAIAAEQRLAEALGAGNEDDKAPSLDDFNSYDEFVDARARYVARQEFKAQQRESIEASRSAAHGQREEVLKAEFAAKVDDARSRMADFDAVAFNPNVPVTAAMQAAILESDMSADIAYYLGKNPEAAYRMTSMSPLSVAREIGRIEQTILSTPVNIKATSAPDPIRPVNQRAPAAKNPDEMTDQEYFAWRKAQKTAR